MMCIAPRRCSCARSPTDYFASRMCIQRSGAAIKVDFFEQVLRRARSLGCAPARRTRSRTAEDRSHAEARSEEHTSELQSLMRISYDVFCLKQKKQSN